MSRWEMNSKRRFYYHYNKPVSKKEGRNFLTLHYRGKCHLVNRISCSVSTESHNQKRQPYCVIRGWANNILIAINPYDEKESVGYIR